IGGEVRVINPDSVNGVPSQILTGEGPVMVIIGFGQVAKDILQTHVKNIPSSKSFFIISTKYFNLNKIFHAEVTAKMKLYFYLRVKVKSKT
ncbi:MAG: hypothetical protein ACTHJT_00015, partial [Cytophaga sp.]|uniref:hypothetical protein n=1 Tax=Cytophaga sp. TaxID=29535 RepID=UPI003F822269